MIPKAISMDLRQIASLLVFFIFYVLFGGTVFMYLEAPLENQKRQEIEELLNEFRDKLKMINHPNITQEHITTMIQKLLVAQDMNLVDRFGNKTEFINWSFFNSFFFAITVTTTIGYGHLTPYTVFGKIFCIIYALFGIPMTGVLIGGIGHRFSICFSNHVSKAKSRYQRQFSVRLMMLKKGLIFFVPWFLVFLVLPAVVFAFIENWTFLEGFYYCFVTLSTIGFGDYVAGSFERQYIWIYKLVVVLWIIFGLAYLSMILNFISQGLRSQRLTDVVLSFRRIPGQPFSNRLHHLNRIRRNKLNRQQSVPIALLTPNGKIIKSEVSINTLETPSLSSPSPTYSQQQSFNDSFDNSKSSESHFRFFHILNLFPYFKHSSRNSKTRDRSETTETFLTINTCPVRRTSSLPDIIEHRLGSIDETDSEILSDNQLKYNKSDNCIVSVVSQELEQPLSANYLNVKQDLLEKRKSFFDDLNSNPNLRVTSV